MKALAFLEMITYFLLHYCKSARYNIKFISSQYYRKFIEITYTYMCQNDLFELNHFIRLDRLPSCTFTLTVNDVFM